MEEWKHCRLRWPFAKMTKRGIVDGCCWRRWQKGMQCASQLLVQLWHSVGGNEENEALLQEYSIKHDVLEYMLLIFPPLCVLFSRPSSILSLYYKGSAFPDPYFSSVNNITWRAKSWTIVLFLDFSMNAFCDGWSHVVLNGFQCILIRHILFCMVEHYSKMP